MQHKTVDFSPARIVQISTHTAEGKADVDRTAVFTPTSSTKQKGFRPAIIGGKRQIPLSSSSVLGTKAVKVVILSCKVAGYAVVGFVPVGQLAGLSHAATYRPDGANGLQLDNSPNVSTMPGTLGLVEVILLQETGVKIVQDGKLEMTTITLESNQTEDAYVEFSDPVLPLLDSLSPTHHYLHSDSHWTVVQLRWRCAQLGWTFLACVIDHLTCWGSVTRIQRAKWLR